MRVLRILPVLLLAALCLAPSARASRSPVEVVASGLDSPRHLAFGSSGDLYVAEAGRGGDVFCFTGGEGAACMGASGAVTKINRWGQRRIASGLPSYANVPTPQAPDVVTGSNAIGPHGIMVLGDQVFITNGGPTEPRDADGNDISRETLASKLPAADLFGWVLRLRQHRSPQKIGDIYGFERAVNPDKVLGNPAVDSNPVDLLFDGRRLVVADAGGNALDTVNVFGRVANLTVFPNGAPVPNPFGGPPIPPQAVPTSVVLGPDRYLYVSQLTGFPFPIGKANIFRVDPRSGKATVFATGFTNLMDLAFDRDGTLYALEIDHDSLLGPLNEGAIFAVNRWGAKKQLTLPAGSLPMPGGITVGRDGLYVSTNSGSPGGGQVVRIRTR